MLPEVPPQFDIAGEPVARLAPAPGRVWSDLYLSV